MNAYVFTSKAVVLPKFFSKQNSGQTMIRNIYKYTLLFYSILFLTAGAVAHAQDSGSYPGWGIDSEYNQLYNYKERDSIKGKVSKFKKITPLPGMSPGTGFIFIEGDEEILVHLCPWDFASPKETGIRKGVSTKLKGSWAVIDDQDIFLAAKVKQGDNFQFKVRLTKDGTPFWSMTKEELEKERNSE
jgi:hypothetical protein